MIVLGSVLDLLIIGVAAAYIALKTNFYLVFVKNEVTETQVVRRRQNVSRQNVLRFFCLCFLVKNE